LFSSSNNSVSDLLTFTGAKYPARPHLRPKMPAKNLADAALSCAGTMV